MGEFNYKEFVDMLELQEGDIIDVASDLMSIMLYCREHKLKFCPDGLIDALIEAVGKTGTVMIRAFSWAFCRGETFDIHSTPSEVGSLGNVAMKREDFRRTQHPIYSWMVTGKYQTELCEYMNKVSFGKGSVFDFLEKRDAKLVLLGNAHSTAMTQVHHAEKLERVPYRFEKNFKASYIDESGHKCNAIYSMYVRFLDIDVDNSVVDSKKTQEQLVKLSIKREMLFDENIKLSVSRIKPLVEFMSHDIKANEGRCVVSVNGFEGYNVPDIDYSKFRKE